MERGGVPAAISLGASPGLALRLPADFFLIPDGDQFLAYAPKSLGVARVNAGAARTLSDARTNPDALQAFDADYLDALADAGLLVARDGSDDRITFPERSDYDPSGLTLFLTTKCTLACTYCYAHGNDRPSMMTWDTAKSGLDWMFRHAVARNRDSVRVMFHGGGEVTIARELLAQCVTYARAEGQARGIRVQTGAGLNGVMKGPLLEWVIANLDGATVSLDGLPEVHNAQRPLVTGQDSFAIVAAALKRMDEAGFNYALRVTVTKLGLSRLVESVEYMCRHFGARVIHLEPVYASGRAVTNDVMSPDPHEFIQQYRLAQDVARAHGRHLRYSGARFGTITNKFCQVSDDLLAITPEGFASSCYEVGDREDPRADTFFYGRLDSATGALDVDMKKVIRLRTLTVEHKSSCDDCFCRFSCAGDCSAKQALAGNAWSADHSPRCTINRALTLDQMRRYAETGVVSEDGPRP
jgi:uncharacterized protein